MKHFTNYNSKQELRAFLDERGLGMRKKYGQNFLINPAVRAMLLDALELKTGDMVWEIGPGLGAMTAGLLERGGKVCAFEIDPAFIKILLQAFAEEAQGNDPAFRLIEGDVLKTWVHTGLTGVSMAAELFLFGNLPYNIAAALLGDFIEKGRLFKRIVVTVQREVAQRMAAKPNSKNYSSFSVMCSSIYKISLLPVIKASSFYPAPRVDSQAVRLDLKPAEKKLPELFYPMVRALFSSRRKKIKNTLSAYASSYIIKGEDVKEAADAALAKAGISGDLRAETLGLDEFAALAASLQEIVFHGYSRQA